MSDLPAWLVRSLTPVRPQVGSTDTGMGNPNHGVSWCENGRIRDLLNSWPRAAQGMLWRSSRLKPRRAVQTCHLSKLSGADRFSLLDIVQQRKLGILQPTGSKKRVIVLRHHLCGTAQIDANALIRHVYNESISP
jgi:hypothetical protein